MKTAAVLIAVATAFGSASARAESDYIMGAHMLTYHSPNIYCDNGQNPGVYIGLPNGATFGTYHNSCERQTFYAGVRTPDWHGASLMFGGFTGYEKPITWMIAPSVAVPLDKTDSVRFAGGVWDKNTIVHLAFERKF